MDLLLIHSYPANTLHRNNVVSVHALTSIGRCFQQGGQSHDNQLVISHFYGRFLLDSMYVKLFSWGYWLISEKN